MNEARIRHVPERFERDTGKGKWEEEVCHADSHLLTCVKEYVLLVTGVQAIMGGVRKREGGSVL
jgi:hypothetical protein